MAVHRRFLERFDLLMNLSDATAEALAQQMTLSSFARRELLLGKDAPDRGLGFLLDGRLQGVDFTLDGREVGLYFVGPGDFFGELSVVDGLPPAEMVIALAKSQALFLPPDAARELVFSTPPLAKQVLERLSARVRESMAQRTLLSLPNPFQRLCALLCKLIEVSGPSVSDAPTHQELAIMINTSRETVTRAFQQLQNREVLRRDGTTLVVLDKAFLLDVAEGRVEPPKT